MSDPTQHRSVAEQPMYIVWMLLFVGLIWSLQVAIPIGLYYASYGPPTIGDWTTMQVPEYSHVALWKERVWYSVMKIGPNDPRGKGTLKSFDPVTGNTSESKLQIPIPMSGFIADGDRLWAVSPNSVVQIEGEQTTEFKPKRILTQPCEPFLYEGQVAVIDLTKSGLPTLLVLQNDEWVELGTVMVPFGFPWATIEGQNVLLPSKAVLITRRPYLDIQVIAHAGRLHLFISDGTIIAHRLGIELAPVSGLAPANVPDVVDLSNLADWEMACPVSSRIGLRGKDLFKVGLVEGEPVVVTFLSSGTNPFQGGTLLAYRRVDGTWRKSAEQHVPAMTELLTVSDGQKTYVAAQSFAQTLRFHEVTNNALRPTGTVLKAPVTPYQQPLERWLRLGQWVYWPGLLVLVLGVSRLMAKYREVSYQFGLANVELASITRRGIARVIDYFLFMIPNYLLAVKFGLTSPEKVADDADKMFDLGPEGMMIRYIWIIFGSFIGGFCLLVLNGWLQGRWGVTLGKWVCGIRTVRTTLRPCGFLRGVLREILLFVESVFMVTWLPATLLIAFTDCRQRLGDLAADTLVIRKPKTAIALDKAASPYEI